MLGFVDVPGHERFVHNMLAGAHRHRLRAAGGRGGRRRDAADPRAPGDPRPARRRRGRGRADQDRPRRTGAAWPRCGRRSSSSLAGTALAGSPVFPVSSITGDGIEDCARTSNRGRSRRSPAATGYFRLAVDRCFTLTGSGTVVTGTVFAGRVQVGDRLVVSPSGQEVRVRSIHAQNRAAESGQAGQRCALNLAGVEKKDIVRGDWVLAPAVHARRSVSMCASNCRPRRDAHSGIGHRYMCMSVPPTFWGACRCWRGRRSSPARRPGPARARSADRKFACDRFILRDQSAQCTLAGGVVLDPFAPARKVRTPARLALLRALSTCHAVRHLEALLDSSPPVLILTGLRAAAICARGRRIPVRGLPMVVVTIAGGHRMVLHRRAGRAATGGAGCSRGGTRTRAGVARPRSAAAAAAGDTGSVVGAIRRR